MGREEVVIWTGRGLLYGLGGGCYMDREEVVIWAGRGLLYGLGGGCYIGREEVVIWTGRGLLYVGKPTCRKAAPSKIGSPSCLF